MSITIFALFPAVLTVVVLAVYYAVRLAGRNRD